MAMGLQNAIDYVEDHLEGEVDISEAARQAALSEFYFQRIFCLLCGMSLGEYIRARRLTLAGSELARSDIRVIDTALKYGYDSPESFTRAFTRFHGIAPSQVRRGGAGLRALSPISVKLILNGGKIMDYKIVNKDPFDVLERAEPQSVRDGANLRTIPEFWDKCKADGTLDRLLELASDRTYVLGICRAGDGGETFDYSVAVPCRAGAATPEGFRRSTVPGGTWAVFPCRGPMPGAIQDLWRRVVSEFFPTSGWKPTLEMDIEAYTDGDMSSEDYESEIWVPVKK